MINMIIVGLIILGIIAFVIGAVGIGYLIIRFVDYREAQDLAPIRLPFKKIKEFYNLAPEKYKITNPHDLKGIFTYIPTEYMQYKKKYIMADSCISWLRSLRFIKQIENNKVIIRNNAYTKDYLQYVLKDAQALQAEAQKQINHTIDEMQKPPVDPIAAYFEKEK